MTTLLWFAFGLAYAGFATGAGLATARYCGANWPWNIAWGLAGAILAPFTVAFLLTLKHLEH